MKKHTFETFATILLVCTAVLSTGIFWYVGTLHKTLAQETRIYLNEFAIQDALHIETQVNEDLDLLHTIAIAIKTADMDEDTILQLIKEERAQHDFKHMEFVNKDGLAILDTEHFLDLSQTNNFKRTMQGITSVSNRVKDLYDGKNILVFSVPIEKNGKVIGALMATRSTADFARILNLESFSGNGYSLLVNADGEKVVESFHQNAISGLYNIFDMPDDPDHRLREQVINDFSNRKAGFVRYESKKRGMLYINYQPLSINDWFLVSVVPAQHLNALTKHFVTLLVVLCLMIAVTGIFLGGYMRHVWTSVFSKDDM